MSIPREWTSWMPTLEQRLDTLNEQSNSQAVVRTSLDVNARSCEDCCSSGLLNLALRAVDFWRSRSMTDCTGWLASVRTVDVPRALGSTSTEVMSLRSDFQARTTFSIVWRRISLGKDSRPLQPCSWRKSSQRSSSVIQPHTMCFEVLVSKNELAAYRHP